MIGYCQPMREPEARFICDGGILYMRDTTVRSGPAEAGVRSITV